MFTQWFIHPVNRGFRYFSDGAGSQYKNYKSLVNLMHHQQDHNLKAEHHFFATSHGKSPCDGIGRTIKREAASASLTVTLDNQILTPTELFTWANDNISGVKMFFISEEDIINHKETFQLNERYNGVKTVPGTRSYHCFIPDVDVLMMKRISADTVFDSHKFYAIRNTDFTVYQPG